MTQREAQIVNQLGLHARPAAQLVRTAAGFASDIRLEKDGMEVNGKSIMGVMMLAAEFGSTVSVRADGPDEAEAVAALCALIAEGFGEA
ncbi:MAG TPA: HPr family phosphocarrier protein [Gemmatimonadales bacterium]|jgi:phosphocarrier protein|nr:HPr family phosphocarrier protein [Gemmatimonadales bacterium]